MKNYTSLICVLSLCTLIMQDATADEIIKLRAGASNNAYELDLIPVNGVSQVPFASTSYSGTNYGITFLLGESAYIDIAGSTGTGTYNRPTYVGNLQRNDTAVILGMNAGSMSSVIGNFYFGYKSGETKLNPPATAPNGSSNLDFVASGMVLGGGLGIPLADGKAGLLGINLGLGIMGAKYDQQNVGSAPNSTAHADTAFGFNYGLLYTFPFTKNFGITLDYKNTSYVYTFDSGLTTQTEIDEKVTSTLASLYVKF